MRLGLSMYGTTFSMGIHPKSGRTPITPRQLIDQAIEYSLEGVEIPVSLLKDSDIEEVAHYAQDNGLFIVVDSGGYNAVELTEAVEIAARIGAGTVRTVVGGAKIGGDRRPLSGRWKPFLEEVLKSFETVTAAAEKHGVNFAVENHQDLASEELLWLCESIGSKRFGIVLDAGNPLATAEEPVDFARRVAPYLKNVHLKDYWIYLSEEGYRLVRCPLGQGVIDFPALLNVFSELCPDVTMAIELGALEARHIRVLADDYWPEYPPRSAAQLAQVMRMVQANAKPPGDWRTPYEKEEGPDAVAAYESRQLESSLAYILPLLHRHRERLTV